MEPRLTRFPTYSSDYAVADRKDVSESKMESA